MLFLKPASLKPAESSLHPFFLRSVALRKGRDGNRAKEIEGGDEDKERMKGKGREGKATEKGENKNDRDKKREGKITEANSDILHQLPLPRGKKSNVT